MAVKKKKNSLKLLSLLTSCYHSVSSGSLSDPIWTEVWQYVSHMQCYTYTSIPGYFHTWSLVHREGRKWRTVAFQFYFWFSNQVVCFTVDPDVDADITSAVVILSYASFSPFSC